MYRGMIKITFVKASKITFVYERIPTYRGDNKEYLQ